MSKLYLISDLDKTLFYLTEKQEEFIKKKEKGKSLSGMSWAKDYYTECSKQKPIEENLRVLKALLPAAHKLIFITSRSEIAREDTEASITNKLKIQNFNLLMRPKEERKKSHLVKKDLLKSVKKFSFIYKEAIIVFEDDLECQRMYQEEGCKVLTP